MRRNTSDNRLYKRLRTHNLRVEYKLKGSDSVYSADAINISAGGICLLRTAVLEKGDIIHIKFPIKMKKIILMGEVLRVEGREVAVKFLDNEDQIEKFVEIFNKEFWNLKMKGNNYIDGIISEPDISREANENEDYDNIFDIDNT